MGLLGRYLEPVGLRVAFTPLVVALALAALTLLVAGVALVTAKLSRAGEEIE